MNKNLEYAVSKSFFGAAEVNELSYEFERGFNEDHGQKLGETTVQLNSELIKNIRVFHAASKRLKAHFTEALNGSDISLAKVWLVKSQPKDTDPNKLPYLPHFDKHRYLKAMVYLHDVDKEHGPIHFGDLLSPSQIEVRRKALPSNYKVLGLNTIKTSELKAGIEPVIGKIGDVVFFDTNAAHCAGIVSKGFERRVIRFDFDVRGFNPEKSLFRRLVSSISSRLR